MSEEKDNKESEEQQGYIIIPSTAFKKDKKKITTQATKVAKLVSTLALLEEGGVEKIPQKMKPHILIGQYKGCWECHIEPDFLLIWKQNDEKRIIVLDRFGSHSELFK